jgi:hypothetical protein
VTPKSRVKRVRVNVTATDIKRGQRSRMCLCPVARAVSRVVKVQVWVGQLAVYVDPQLSQVMAKTPAQVATWISRFDLQGRKGLKPFSFMLELPE